MRFITFTFIALVFTAPHAKAGLDFSKPSHNTVTCVHTPSQLMQRPDIVSWLQALRDKQGRSGLAAISGVWKYSILIRSYKFQILMDSSGFYIINDEDEPAEQVSLCLDHPQSPWMRISAHSVEKPENKNTYVRPTKVGRIDVMADATRTIGTAEFKKISD